MIGMLVRALGSVVYHHPQVEEDVPRKGPFGRLKIALVTDHFTADCLSMECRVRSITPANYADVIEHWQPDMVFVESVFHGAGGSWRYEVAQQPKWLRLGPPAAILRVVSLARRRGIPTVFWNKDDGAFFDAFIDVAKAFDYVFTTDRECLERYRRQVPAGVPVDTLAMPYQPAFHAFAGFHFTRREACFTGSYYRRILDNRRQFLDMVFDACDASGLVLNAYDRNHNRLSRHFEFRFPKRPNLHVHGAVPHRQTAQIYRSHVASLNVNSVTDSETMCSRRLLEILACGGIAVTNPSRAVDALFRPYCHVLETREQAEELFARLQHGPSAEDMERAEAGARYVAREHTWSHRLKTLCEVVGL